MEKIKIPKITLQLTVEEVQYLNDLIGKDEILEAVPTASPTTYLCPRCGGDAATTYNNCPWCGQALKCIVTDYVPFTAE